jgi:exopolyphosphatase/guanosine-5'-triphosphate,3'-diphosphate pyrophosphatase
MDPNNLYAAVDLGSVSFHLVIMAKKKNRLVWVDCKKEIVRLASGVDRESGQLLPEVERRALKCLGHFQRALGQIPTDHIRAVGTSSFRTLNDQGRFLQLAEETLGQPIQVLSGDDEAKYIYRGVSYDLPDDIRFVIDIGGGSTELIVGQGKELVQTSSLDLGCVTLTHQFFADGKISPEQFQLCEQFVQTALQPVKQQFADVRWESELGTSGSIKAISWALQNLNFSDGEITREALEELRAGLLQCHDVNDLSRYLHINRRRASLFCAGFIILQQTFRELGLSYIRISQGAIREGLIDELIGTDTAA